MLIKKNTIPKNKPKENQCTNHLPRPGKQSLHRTLSLRPKIVSFDNLSLAASLVLILIRMSAHPNEHNQPNPAAPSISSAAAPQEQVFGIMIEEDNVIIQVDQEAYL